MPAPVPAPEAETRSKNVGDSVTHSQNSKAKTASNRIPNQTNEQNKYEGERYVTRIHGKYYDLTSFKHPGGPIAIASIQGRDGTELFESHHIFTDKNVKQILEKYEMPGPPAEEITINNVYDWEATLKDPFTIELKDIARKQLGKDIKINWYRTVEITILFLIAVSQMYKFGQGEWYSLFTLPLAWWVFGVNLFHDGSHFSISENWKINELSMDLGFMFATPYVWMHQHVIGHHSFPNIMGKDPDLYHAPRFVRHSNDIRVRYAHTIQYITFIGTWIVGVPAGLLLYGIYQSLNFASYNKVVKFANNKYLNTDTLRLRRYAYFLIIHILPFILHGLTWKGLIFSLIPIYLVSVFFMISSQINHLTPDSTDKFDKNFFKHQIITASNVAPDSYLVFVFTGGLNLQTEHHLFPSVNHIHLRKMQPYIRDLCKKYNVQYNETHSLWNALKLHVQHLFNKSGIDQKQL